MLKLETRPGALPNEAQTALVQAALGEASALERFRAQWAGRPWSDMPYPWQKLLPMVLHSLGESALLPDELAVARTALDESERESNRIRDGASQLLSALHDRGVKTLLLKGLAVGTLYYPDLACRPMGDFDVLVPPEQMQTAWKVLVQQGWWPQLPRPLALHAAHACAFQHPLGPTVDLHWFALNTARWPGGDDAFWRYSVPFEQGAIHSRVLCPAHTLLHLAVHGSTGGHSGLWVVDCCRLLRQSTVDWTELEQEARRRGVGRLLAHSLTTLQRDFGAPVPADVLARLQAQRPPLLARALVLLAGRRRDWLSFLFLPVVEYLQFCRPKTPWHAARGLALFLCQRWGLRNPGELPAEVGFRLRKALASKLGHEFTPADNEEFVSRQWGARRKSSPPPAAPVIQGEATPPVGQEALVAVRDFWSCSTIPQAAALIHPEHNQESWALDAAGQILSPLVRRQLSPLSDKIGLEIGSGLGRMLRVMDRHLGRVYGVDISPRMVELSRLYLGPQSPIQCFACDGSSLPFQAESVDLVFSVICFQHIPTRDVIQKYMAEAHRVLRPGGILRAQTVTGARSPNAREGYRGNGYVYPSLEEYVGDFRQAGFQVVEATRAGELYMWVTGLKMEPDAL